MEGNYNALAGGVSAWGLGRQGGRGGFGSGGALGTAQASSFAPYPAPSGSHWEFVTNAATGGDRVTANSGQPVVSLVTP